MNRFIMAVLATLALLFGVALGAQEKPAEPLPNPSLTVEVSPKFQILRVGRSTADVLFRAIVPKNAQNRVLCVGIDGPVYRSSCWEHQASGRLLNEFRYPSLPAGDYVAFGELQWVSQEKGERKTTLARYEFRIIGE